MNLPRYVAIISMEAVRFAYTSKSRCTHQAAFAAREKTRHAARQEALTLTGAGSQGPGSQEASSRDTRGHDHQPRKFAEKGWRYARPAPEVRCIRELLIVYIESHK